MDEPRDCHTKKSQIIHKITCMQKLKCDTNELIYETDSQDRPVVAKGKENGKEEDWGLGISRCIIYRMEKQDPTVSTENYVQYPLTSHDGKEYEKECIYVCVCVCVYIYIYIYIFLCCT